MLLSAKTTNQLDSNIWQNDPMCPKFLPATIEIDDSKEKTQGVRKRHTNQQLEVIAECRESYRPAKLLTND